MFDVYIIPLPWTYTKRVLAFKNRAKAEEILAELQKSSAVGGTSSDPFKINILTVYDDVDVEVVPQ